MCVYVQQLVMCTGQYRHQLHHHVIRGFDRKSPEKLGVSYTYVLNVTKVTKNRFKA